MNTPNMYKRIFAIAILVSALISFKDENTILYCHGDGNTPGICNSENNFNQLKEKGFKIVYCDYKEESNCTIGRLLISH